MSSLGKRPIDKTSKAAEPQRQQQSLAKSLVLKDYRQRLKDNIKSIRDNFAEIVKLAKVEDDSQLARVTQHEQEMFEMEVRAANISKAAENLIKLISDIREFYVLNDFAFANQAMAELTAEHNADYKEAADRLHLVKEEAVADLYEIEQEYFSCSTTQM